MAIVKRTGLICAALMALAASALPASAATYMFTFQNDDLSYNGVEYGNVLINGTFTVGGALPSLITAITGTVSGTNNVLDGTITGLSSYADSDNILYQPGPLGNYSFGGVSFNVTNGSQTAAYNLFDWNSSTYLIYSGFDSVGYDTSGTSTGSLNVSVVPNLVTPVPEPAVWAMMLVGFGSIGFLLRTSRRRQGAVAVV